MVVMVVAVLVGVGALVLRASCIVIHGRVLAAGGHVDQMAFPIMHNGGIRWIRGGPERVMEITA